MAAALVRSLFCGYRPGQNRMAVFVSYSDKAENKNGDFLVSGYIAEESSWAFLSERVAGTGS